MLDRDDVRIGQDDRIITHHDPERAADYWLTRLSADPLDDLPPEVRGDLTTVLAAFFRTREHRGYTIREVLALANWVMRTSRGMLALEHYRRGLGVPDFSPEGDLLVLPPCDPGADCHHVDPERRN